MFSTASWICFLLSNSYIFCMFWVWQMEAWVWRKGLELLHFSHRHGTGGWWGQWVLHPSDLCGRALSWVARGSLGCGRDPCQEPKAGHLGEGNSDLRRGCGHCCPPVSSVTSQGETGYDPRGDRRLGEKTVLRPHLWYQLSWAAAALWSPATLALPSIIFCWERSWNMASWDFS